MAVAKDGNAGINEAIPRSGDFSIIRISMIPFLVHFDRTTATTSTTEYIKMVPVTCGLA
ncbi:MAG: hypothetical protein ACXWV9_05380 [Flavisolibacter sp.]